VYFLRLFEVCDNKEGIVAEYAAKGWHLELRRMVGDEEMMEWIELQSMFRGVSLTQNEDEVSWG
jgi:hypothetical protein